MRADSRCLFRKAFSARPAARCTPRGGNGAPTADSTKARPNAKHKAGASWKRSSLSLNSAPAPAGKRNGALALPNARPGSGFAGNSRAARNPSGLSSVVMEPSSNRSNRLPKVSSARGGGDAADGAGPARSRDRGSRPALHSRGRTRRGHRVRHSSRDLPAPKIRSRVVVRVRRVAAANADSVAAVAAGVVVARHHRNHRRSDKDRRLERRRHVNPNRIVFSSGLMWRRLSSRRFVDCCGLRRRFRRRPVHQQVAHCAL